MLSVGRVDLSTEYAAIAVTGDDTIKLLQNLVTCDMQALSAERSVLGSFPNAKGRVIVLFRAMTIEHGCVLFVPRALAERTLAHLQFFKFRAKVTFSNLADSHALIGVMGAEARGWIAARFEVAPEEPGGSVDAAGVRVIRLHGAAPRYWVFGAKAQIDTASQPLPWIEAGLPMWQLAEVEAGIPKVLPETSEAFLPQNLNLEALGALSFSKGCYPGQEVIARTQHLGTVKRRLMRGRSEAAGVEPGTPLRAVHDGAEQDGGKVLYEVERLLLAVIPLELFEADACFYTESSSRIAVKNWERL